jgi:DNA-directed RNA polymerase I subunit RPA2
MNPNKRKTLEFPKLNGQRVPSYSEKFVSSAARQRLEHLVSPHVDSFNYFLEFGLNEAISDIPQMEFLLPDGPNVKIRFTEAQISYPTKNDDFSENTTLTPREARERGISYTGSMLAHVVINVDDIIDELGISSRFGEMPIMVKSDRCHLKG